MYQANAKSYEGLPFDLMCEDPHLFQKRLRDVIALNGSEPALASINKEKWHLAILRSGGMKDPRALWIDYDSGGLHGHFDGMTIGLFAKGLDLLPDFGYPPVNYGGWSSPKARWYFMTMAHNTVEVDRRNQMAGTGKTTLWCDGHQFRAIRASGKELYGVMQYERNLAMIDASDEDFYVLDIFRVVGGHEHRKYIYGSYGTLTTQCLMLNESDNNKSTGEIENIYFDPSPVPGWQADWKINDEYKYLPVGAQVHLRYTDLTDKVKTCVGQAWISKGYSSENERIPVIYARRRCEEGSLASTFTGVFEPYDKSHFISAIKRLPIEAPDGRPYPDANVAVEVSLISGRRDLIISADVENPLRTTPSLAKQGTLVQRDWNVALHGEMCWIRMDLMENIRNIAKCRASGLMAGNLELRLKKNVDFIELLLTGYGANLIKGDVRDILDFTLNGKSIIKRDDG